MIKTCFLKETFTIRIVDLWRNINGMDCERHYRRYERLDSRKKRNPEKMAQSPWHVSCHIEPKEEAHNDPNGFLAWWQVGCLCKKLPLWFAAHGLKILGSLKVTTWFTFTETGVKSYLIPHWSSHGAYSGSASWLVINCFLFIQEMSVMKTGFATLIRLNFDG